MLFSAIRVPTLGSILKAVKRFLLIAALLAAWPPAPAYSQAPRQDDPPEEQEPPEEDDSLKPKEYTFNPLQAEKEMKIGAFYFKKSSFRAASMRFDEATKWNPALAEAWRMLGDAREKLEDGPGAVTAYRKFLELAPESKQAGAIKKKLPALAKMESKPAK